MIVSQIACPVRPAVEEAQRIAREAPAECRCAVHLVEGAGHAGATDERVDLRAVIEGWRAGLS